MGVRCYKNKLQQNLTIFFKSFLKHKGKFFIFHAEYENFIFQEAIKLYNTEM